MGRKTSKNPRGLELEVLKENPLYTSLTPYLAHAIVRDLRAWSGEKRGLMRALELAHRIDEIVHAAFREEELSAELHESMNREVKS